MEIFNYDKYRKDGFSSYWTEECKSHRVKNNLVVDNDGRELSVCRDWTSTVPNFMVGDKVVIKTWEQMEKEYGLDCFRNIEITPSFNIDMKHLCGKVAIIIKIKGKHIKLGFEEKNIGDTIWAYTTDMIELAYPIVRGCDKKKEIDMTKHWRVETKKDDLAFRKLADSLGYKWASGDRFDLEKGIMLCMLKDKGITYKDITKAVKSAERVIEHKFNIGDIVRVVDKGVRYSTYTEWFREQGKTELLGKHNASKELKNGKKLKVVAFGLHGVFCGKMLYACEDLKGDIYLIGEYGIEKAE